MNSSISPHHKETNSRALGKNRSQPSPCFQETQRTKESVGELYHKTLKMPKPVVRLMLNV